MLAPSRAERTLSTRELNRALLARQLLLERSDDSVVHAVERVGGLQTQYAPSAYIGLWSRLRGFARGDLTDALVRRRVVQATLMRDTIHIVSAGDFPLLAAAIRRGRREWWTRVAGSGLAGADMEAAADLVRDLLAGGPRPRAELFAALEAAGYPRPAIGGVGLWVDLVRVPPSGTWDRRRADLYGLADTWLTAERPAEDEGLDHLVRRYLEGFGPATVNDLAGWSGLTATTLRPTIERASLRRFRDEQGRELLDLPRAPLPDPDTPAPVRFLPTWDATLLVHARRTQILPERFRSLVFSTKTPHSVPTFLVDGQVAGTWRYEDGHVRLDPFERLPAATRRALDREAEALAAFHA
jgi:hypothetical protein